MTSRLSSAKRGKKKLTFSAALGVGLPATIIDKEDRNTC